MHEDWVHCFFNGWDDVEYAIQLGNFDQFHGVIGETGQDENATVFLQYPVAHQKCAESGTVCVFHFRQVEDNISDSFGM